MEAKLYQGKSYLNASHLVTIIRALLYGLFSYVYIHLKFFKFIQALFENPHPVCGLIKSFVSFLIQPNPRDAGRKPQSVMMYGVSKQWQQPTFSHCEAEILPVHLSPYPPCSTNIFRLQPKERVELFCAFVLRHIKQLFASPFIYFKHDCMTLEAN